MDAALLIARLVLAGVFTLAGVAKLADLKGSRQAIIDFGVPSAMGAPLGLLLPLAELAVAATLLAGIYGLVGGSGGAGAPLCVRGGHLHQPGPRPEARLPLLRAAALRPGRVEDPRPQRSPRCRGRLRPLGGLRRRGRAQRGRLARSPLDGPAAGPPRRGSRARPLGRAVVVPGAPPAAERAALGAPGGLGGKRLPQAVA